VKKGGEIMGDGDFGFGFILGMGLIVIVITILTAVATPITDANIFCAGEFGHNTTSITRGSAIYCQKILDNGQIAQREIIKMNNKWFIKDGVLETLKTRDE
jgi:hypothetical protein